jgi:hypothetical protein
MGSTQSKNITEDISKKYTTKEIQSHIENVLVNNNANNNESTSSVDTLNWFKFSDTPHQMGGNNHIAKKEYEKYDIRKTFNKIENIQHGGEFVSITDTQLSQDNINTADSALKRFRDMTNILSGDQDGGRFNNVVKKNPTLSSSIRTDTPISINNNKKQISLIMNLLKNLNTQINDNPIENSLNNLGNDQEIDFSTSFLNNVADFEDVNSFPKFDISKKTITDTNWSVNNYQTGGQNNSEIIIAPYSSTESTNLSHHFPYNTSRFL